MAKHFSCASDKSCVEGYSLVLWTTRPEVPGTWQSVARLEALAWGSTHLDTLVQSPHFQVSSQLSAVCSMDNQAMKTVNTNVFLHYTAIEHHYQLLTHLNRSWPAVSQICNLIFWPETSTILVPNSTPIVWGQSAITAWEGRRGRRRDGWRGRWRERSGG